MNRSIRRLYIVLAAGFGLVLAMLGYWQIVAADSLNRRSDNPTALQRDRLIQRGRIISADGQILASSRRGRVRGQRVFQRVYAKPTLAPHVLGYTTPEQGKTGIEASYDRYLGGSYGTEPLLQRLRLRTRRGADVHLTLDARVQEAATVALAGRRGSVVALVPSTGAVLAMVSEPGFDLAKVRTDFPSILKADGKPLLNRATQERYPPGSTFKVVTASAALDSGQYQPTSKFDDPGRIVKNGQVIRNFGGQVFGVHDLSTALTRSINTTFARIGEALGSSLMGTTMTGFGFGKPPAIDLPDGQAVTSGRFRGGSLLPNDAADGDTSRLAIGQESLAVTPLQMALVSCAIANGGTLVRPYLVDRAVDRRGRTVFKTDPKNDGTATKATTAADVAGMMGRVVDEGTGRAASLDGLSVAGKTGTAETGASGSNDAWFIGFAPRERPVVAVAVVIEDTPGTGGVVAAPVAAAVMRAAIEAKGGGG